MLVRLLLLKRLSPVWFWIKMASLAVFALVFFLFVAECACFIIRPLVH